MNIENLLIGEDDYEIKMENVVVPWAKDNVRDTYFTASDGARLHYHFAIPEDPKAVIVMVHGFCEFYPKYHEMSYYYYQMGYAFFFLEQRGHGFSRRYVEEMDKVTVDSYDSYVQDLKEFITFVIDREESVKRLKKILFAHSMGGAVSSLYLIKNPDTFDAAILSSPMIKMSIGNHSEFSVRMLMALSVILRWNEKFVPGQSGFTGVEDFENSSTLSPKRFHYIFTQRVNHKQYQTWGGTYAWTRASIKATDYLDKNLEKIKTPVLLFEAGRDNKVEASGIQALRNRGKNVQYEYLSESKHEIFNSTDKDRVRYYKILFDFIEKQLI